MEVRKNSLGYCSTSRLEFPVPLSTPGAIWWTWKLLFRISALQIPFPDTQREPLKLCISHGHSWDFAPFQDRTNWVPHLLCSNTSLVRHKWEGKYYIRGFRSQIERTHATRCPRCLLSRLGGLVTKRSLGPWAHGIAYGVFRHVSDVQLRWGLCWDHAHPWYCKACWKKLFTKSRAFALRQAFSFGLSGARLYHRKRGRGT